MGAMIEILGIGIILSLAVALAYRFGTNQSEVKKLKKQAQKHKKKMDKAKKKGNQKEMNREMKKMMNIQGKTMKMNMKPMIITFIIIIPFIFIAFPSLYGAEIVPMDKGNIELNGEKVSFQASKNSIIINGGEKNYGDMVEIEGENFEIQKRGEKIKFERVVLKLPFTLPFFGNTIGWLGTYILVAIPFTQFFRKILGVEG